ncbi:MULTISPECIES: NUDIX domain-containing protein [Microbacterium]|uniref:NUDIX domain-containing protein n=1 Tax=Microbacterium TaxID=33882 RepID=UPI0011EB9EE8|nr:MULTISPECIES: NUDIX domain-containing protein [Microbacterium]
MTTVDEDLPQAGTVVLLRPSADGFHVLLLRRPSRGSFADAWVFPGGKVEPEDRRVGATEVEDARRAAARETAEEVGLVVDELVPLSEWRPPAEAPVRIRTWFFLALAPDAEPSPSPDEVMELTWVSPAGALARHAAGEWQLFPPTWVTLHRLSALADVDAVLASTGAVELFQTRVSDGGRAFGWAQGTLHARRLPWRFDPA